MKKYLHMKFSKWFIYLALLAFISGSAFGQTVTELVVPKYFGGKTAASQNNARTPFAACFQITGLLPNTTYDVKTQIGLVTEASTAYGAGNVWSGTGFSGSTVTAAFTTDANGDSGPFWIYYQPTGNSSRFAPGQQHTIRMSWVPTGGTFPTNAMWAGSKILTALDIATNPYTPETTDDGAYIKGTANVGASGKFVLLWDNVNGTGDPLFAYQIRDAIPTQPTQSQLNTEINDIYMQAGTSVTGDYPAIVPIGANNPNGIRRIESRNADNTTFAFSTDADGIWPSGANTTDMNRLDIRYITATDAPLIPQGIPSVTTASATNITYNSATSGGTVTSSGGATVTARGVCWSTNPSPTLSDPHTTDGSGVGTFVSQITGLQPATTYYVRAYATNSFGTAYGNEISFTTATAPYPPVVDFVASSTSIPVGSTVNFTDLSTNGPTSWSWSFVGGIPPSSNQQNPTGILYSYAGQYTVCLTATNQYGSNTLCKDAYITVNPPVDANIVITEIMYNPPEIGTDSLEFIELYNNGSNSVDLDGFYFSDGVTYTFPPTIMEPGSYLVVAVNAQAMQHTFGVTAQQWTSGALNNGGELIRLKDKFGFTVDSVYYDDALPWDTLADGWGPSLTLCDPNANNALAESWVHSTEFAAINANGDTIWATPGGPCIIPIPPVADFVGNPTTIHPGETVTFTDLSSGPDITTWEWTFEGGTPSTFSGQTPPPITYNSLGTFDVTLTVTNAFGTSTTTKSDYIEVIINPGMEEVHNTGLSIEPNPATDQFNLTLKQGNYRMEVVSLTGEKVLTYTFTGNKFTVHVKALPRGIYFVKVTDDKGNAKTQKLILQ
ncbi:MAG: PKD domain-containing protein [Bacteroidales bacterium]